MTCPDCGHEAHAGRCEVWMAVVDRTKDLEPTQCPCTTRRSTDGDADGARAAESGAAGDSGVRPGSGDDVAAVAKDIERRGDKVVAEMKRIQGKLDAAFPLLTEFRDRMRALEARR